MECAELNYEVIQGLLNVYCNKKELTCLIAAQKAHEIGTETLGFFSRIYYSFIDFFANYINYFKQKQFSLITQLIQPALQDQEKFIKRRDEIEAFAKKNFTIYATNVKHLIDAEVICLGEFHDSVSHQINHGHLIDLMANPSDLILVENTAENPRNDPQVVCVRSSIPVKGWDRRVLTSQGAAQIQEGADLFKKGKALMTTFWPTFYALLLELGARRTIFFSAAIPLYQCIKGLHNCIVGSRSIKQGWQKITSEFQDRNRSLCERVDQCAQKGRRTYVIAGMDHLRSFSGRGSFNYLNPHIQDLTYQETLAALQKRKFAILLPKQT